MILLNIKYGNMRKLIISIIVFLVLIVALEGCSSSRKSKSLSNRRGLMLLDNTELSRNKAYYSKHNVKNKRDTQKKFRKNR